MPQQAATVESVGQALELVKAMQGDGLLECGEDWRPPARRAPAEIIEGQMAAAVDRHLDQLGARDLPDRRNGHYSLHKRYLIHVAGFNLGILMRALFGCGTPREAASAGSAFLFAIQTDVGFTLVTLAQIEGAAAMLVITVTTEMN